LLPKKETLTSKTGDYTKIRFSPDGKRLAVEIRDKGVQDIWVYEIQRESWTRLTFGGAIYIEPVWSPDGRHIVFASFPGGMFWTRSDGSAQPQPLTQSKADGAIQAPISFSPDGKRVAYYATESGGQPQLWTLPVEDTGGQLKAGTPERFLSTKFTDVDPTFSPDGHWLAYVSDATGKREVYVRPFPQPDPSKPGAQGGQWQISNAGGVEPVWSSNGRDLLYRTRDQIMAASYSVKGGTFVQEKPRVWLAKLSGSRLWDLHPDGKRVAVVMPVSTPDASAPKAEHEVVFLVNFFDDLRRRAPLK
jgi:serine/threonine-protein kinase